MMNKTPSFTAVTKGRCAVTTWGNEYQLTATEAIKEGEVIVGEMPLVSVVDVNPKYTTYAWDLVDRILSKTENIERYFALHLKVSKFLFDPQDQKIARDLAKKYRCTRDMVKTIYFGVCTNNIGYKDSHGRTVGHGIYPILSRANHSCRPNASHKAGNVVKKEVTLVAVHDIQAGEAVTWNYANTPSFNEADYESRNFNLMNSYRFVCRCERCNEEIPAVLAKLPSLTQYFDGLIKECVRELAKRL